MPIVIYSGRVRLRVRPEIGFALRGEWTLPTQVSALETWLHEHKRKIKKGCIRGHWVTVRKDAGGGDRASIEMMHTMAALAITLFLSEYPAEGKKTKSTRRCSDGASRFAQSKKRTSSGPVADCIICTSCKPSPKGVTASTLPKPACREAFHGSVSCGGAPVAGRVLQVRPAYEQVTPEFSRGAHDATRQTGDRSGVVQRALSDCGVCHASAHEGDMRLEFMNLSGIADALGVEFAILTGTRLVLA